MTTTTKPSLFSGSSPSLFQRIGKKASFPKINHISRIAGATTLVANFHKVQVRYFTGSIQCPQVCVFCQTRRQSRLKIHVAAGRPCKSLYALGFSSELLLTSDDTLFFSYDSYGHNNTARKKAVFHHKFPHHNLTVEAVWPGLFVDKSSNYWDVPFSVAVDLGSVASDSGPSYHLTMHHNSGSLKLFEGDENSSAVLANLLPGFSFKSAFAYKKNVDVWRSKAQMLKWVQPYDIFLSDPRVSASGIIGATVTASVGENSVRSPVENDSEGVRGFHLHASDIKSAVSADLFGSVALTAQHGTFQRLFSDLTQFHARLDFPSGFKFLSGATHLAQDFFNSQQPTLATLQAVCPNVFFSLQQQIAGPFSFRIDSELVIDLQNRDICAKDSLFAIEYALQVLGSAKAVAWYAPKHKEFMIRAFYTVLCLCSEALFFCMF